jgi:hypothetical protein
MATDLASIVPVSLSAVFTLATNVLNGPTVCFGSEPTDATGDMVWIGWDAFTDSSARFDRDWAEAGANYGAKQLTEGDLFCSLWAEDGDGSAVAVYESALAILTDLSAALRADPTLGIPELLNCYLKAEEWRQDHVANRGAVCHVSFAVHVTAFI